MPNVQICVRDLDGPKEIWDTLLKRLDFTVTRNGRAMILIRFLNARPTSEETVEEYIARLQSYQAQLHSTDEAISDGLLKTCIYETVPPEFKGLITILRDNPGITVETIISRLALDEEERRNKLSSRVALHTQGSYSGRGRGRGGYWNRGGRGRGGRGWGRGGSVNRSDGKLVNRSDGQQVQSNTQSSTSSESNKRKLSEVVCYQCGEIGHYRRKCPLKKRVDEAIKSVKRQRTQSQSTGSQALVATNQETSLV